MLRPERDMAKNNKVAAARKAFVQARAEKTGRTTSEDKAKFRERFEKLAATKEGRAKIQEVTGLSGIRKELKSAYSAPTTTTTKTTTTTTTRKTEAQSETAMRSNPLPYGVVRPKTETSTKSATTTAASTSSRAASTDSMKGLNAIQKTLIGGGAAAAVGAATYGLSNRAYKLAQIKNISTQASALGMNPAEVNAQLRGLGYKPKSIGKAASARGRGFIGSLRGGGLDLLQ